MRVKALIGSPWLPVVMTCALVEFIPLDDIQVQQLTRGREQIYQDWTLENLCAAFQTQYAFCKVIPIPESGRSLIELAS